MLRNRRSRRHIEATVVHSCTLYVTVLLVRLSSFTGELFEKPKGTWAFGWGLPHSVINTAIGVYYRESSPKHCRWIRPAQAFGLLLLSGNTQVRYGELISQVTPPLARQSFRRWKIEDQRNLIGWCVRSTAFLSTRSAKLLARQRHDLLSCQKLLTWSNLTIYKQFFGTNTFAWKCLMPWV